jgi:hypothetical protein
MQVFVDSNMVLSLRFAPVNASTVAAGVKNHRHVRDGAATECDFGGFEHDQDWMLNFNLNRTQLFSEFLQKKSRDFSIPA